MPAHPEDLFAEVYRDHTGLMVKTAHAFTASAADRDELFQDILIAVWQALPQFRAEAKLSTYVYRVAHSCALNWKRSRQRYQQKLDRFAVETPELTAAPEQRERIAWLYARIHQLPPVDRTLILLHLDKISYADMADITGLTESNIGVRLHRIKQQLTVQSKELTP
jgi:RNA polymerase sigma-70 factor (ECF subfamily)